MQECAVAAPAFDFWMLLARIASADAACAFLGWDDLWRAPIQISRIQVPAGWIYGARKYTAAVCGRCVS